jgi:hypothetical protein
MSTRFGLKTGCHIISPKGFTPSVLRPNLIFLGSLEKVLLMAKVEMFPLPTISRMLNLSISLSLDMPKQELSFPSISEHTLQTVNDR